MIMITISRHVRIILLCRRRLIGIATDPPAIGNLITRLMVMSLLIPSLIPSRLGGGTCRDDELLLCLMLLCLVSYDLMSVGNR